MSSSTSIAEEPDHFDKTEPLAYTGLDLPFQGGTRPKINFENVWRDSRKLEDEIEVLQWIARRKEMEWDCAKQMISKKKLDIKEVKKKINMVRTINDLGPQLNIDSDDEDTPYEEDDSDSSANSSIEDNSSQNGDVEDMPLFVRQPSPPPPPPKKKAFIVADFVYPDSHFSKGHLCLRCKEKPPKFVCSSCKNHWYCSTMCQKQDWPQHQRKCSQGISKQSKDVGAPRGLIKFPLPEDLRALVHSEKPETLAQAETTNCMMCKFNKPYFLCSECRNHWYCSYKCHLEHWEIHQKRCFSFYQMKS